MELFVVKNSANKTVADSLQSKQQAKAIRDELGGIEKGFRVSRGKDNLPSPRGYASMMRRKPTHCK